MNENRKRILSRVAYLYYEKGYTQNQISINLNVNRTTVSRMLKQARNQNIVDIQINYTHSELFELELELQNKFNLQQAIIVPTEKDESTNDKNDRLANEAALYLKQNIQPNNTVGFAWGAVLARMIGKINNPVQIQSTFVPLVGGPSSSNTQYHVNGIVYDAARQFGGRSMFVDAAAVQETSTIRDGIISSNYFKDIQNAWCNLDIAFVGIGGPLHHNSTSRWRDLLTKNDYDLLRERGAIGDCCCTFFDHDGKILTGDLMDRTIAIPLEQLKKTKTVVGVARSLAKTSSIRALLKMNILTTLITDKETAQSILNIS